MKDQFTVYFEDGMPKGTAQQKGYNRRTGQYYQKANVEAASRQFYYALLPHRPKMPSGRPIRLVVWFAWEIKKKSMWGKYKPTRPDTDNYIKEFKDVMTKLGFWNDDAQVVDERIIKVYADKASAKVYWEELEDSPWGWDE